MQLQRQGCVSQAHSYSKIESPYFREVNIPDSFEKLILELKYHKIHSLEQLKTNWMKTISTNRAHEQSYSKCESFGRYNCIREYSYQNQSHNLFRSSQIYLQLDKRASISRDELRLLLKHVNDNLQSRLYLDRKI